MTFWQPGTVVWAMCGLGLIGGARSRRGGWLATGAIATPALLACAVIVAATHVRGTPSPKNTTSGLSTPPQWGQAGTRKAEKSIPSRSASPSGAARVALNTTVARYRTLI